MPSRRVRLALVVLALSLAPLDGAHSQTGARPDPAPAPYRIPGGSAIPGAGATPADATGERARETPERDEPRAPVAPAPSAIPPVGVDGGSLPARRDSREPRDDAAAPDRRVDDPPAAERAPAESAPDGERPRRTLDPTRTDGRPVLTTQPAPEDVRIPPAPPRSPETEPRPPAAPALQGTQRSRDATDRLLAPPPPTISSAPAPPAPAGVALPPAATFDVKTGIGWSEDFTDNVRRTRRERESSLRSALTPTATLLINAPTAKGQVGFNLSGVHDSGNEELSLFHSLTGQLAWQATPRFTVAFNDTLTRTDEPSQADRLALRRERGLFTSNNFAVTGNYQRDNVGLAANYKLSTFFQDQLTGGDTISHSFGVTPTVSLLPPNQASAGYEVLGSDTSGRSSVSGHRVHGTYTRQLNDQRTAGVTGSWAIRFVDTEAQGTAPATEERFHEWSFSGFNTMTMPGRFALRGSLGLTGLTSDSGRNDMNLTTQSGLTWQLARGVLGLTVEQGYAETFAEGENLGVVRTRTADLSFTYPFTPSISGTAGASYRQNDFTGEGGPAPTATKDDTWGASLAVVAQLTRWLTLNVEYTFTTVRSTRIDGGFAENRARFSLAASF